MKQLPLFDYSTLKPADRRFVREREAEIKRLAKVTCEGVVQIGEHLIEVKDRLEHGKFLEWLRSAFGWSQPTASRFIAVAKQFKLSTVNNLTIDISVLYLLVEKKTPEPVRTEVIRRAKKGETVTREQVRVLRKKYEETGELPSSLTTLVAMAVDVKQDQSKKPLPSPAEARKIAIATGAHTLSTSGYMPPMSVADQKQWDADFSRVSGLTEFLRWIETAGEQKEFAALLHKRHWTKWMTDKSLEQAAEWIDTLRKVLWENEAKSQKAS